MSVEPNLKLAIEDCQKAFNNGWAFVTAERFDELMEAGEGGLISSQWRTEIDAKGLSDFIDQNRASIEEEWRNRFDHLKSILESEDALEYEEVLFVLSTRSGLQFVTRFLTPQHVELLKGKDGDLQKTVSQNLRAIKELKSKGLGLELYLPSHWWWNPEWVKEDKEEEGSTVSSPN